MKGQEELKNNITSVEELIGNGYLSVTEEKKN